MTRAETIVQLLILYPEAVSGGGGNLGNWIGSGPDSKVLTFGPLYHINCPKGCDGRGKCCSPFPELARCLTLLEQHRPVQYRHLKARYYGGTEARRQIKHVKRGAKFVPLGLQPHQEIRKHPGTFAFTIARHHTGSQSTVDCLVHTWPMWVRQHKVDLAVAYLAARYRGTPVLPVQAIAA